MVQQWKLYPSMLWEFQTDLCHQCFKMNVLCVTKQENDKKVYYLVYKTRKIEDKTLRQHNAGFECWSTASRGQRLVDMRDY